MATGDGRYLKPPSDVGAAKPRLREIRYIEGSRVRGSFEEVVEGSKRWRDGSGEVQGSIEVCSRAEVCGVKGSRGASKVRGICGDLDTRREVAGIAGR